MESDHVAQLRPLHPSSHMSLYNSTVISATVPNLSLDPNFLTIHGSITNNSIDHDLNQTTAFTTLQASSSNPTLTPQATAHLIPAALTNIKFHQVRQPSLVPKIEERQTILQNDRPVLNVTILNPLTAMAHHQTHMFKPGVAEGDTISTNSSSNPTDDSRSRASDVSTMGRTVKGQHKTKKSATINDDNKNNLSNSYATTNNGKEYRCLVCNRQFSQRGNLKTHARTHLGPTERPYDCKTCGKRFTQKGNRDIHLKIHTGTKDHTCPYCDRGFTQRGNLKTHIRSVHTGEKPFSCNICGKKFSQKANMLTHFRTHDKSARFPCNLCNKTFSQKGNLKTHQNRHYQEVGRNKK